MEFSLKPTCANFLPICIALSLALTGCGSESKKDNTKTQLVELQNIAPAELCEFGGHRINTGPDANNNGLLEEIEILSSTYSCNPPEELVISAKSMLFQTAEDEPLSGQLLVSDNTEVITYHLSLHPFKGALALNDDGSFVYTPNDDAIGNDVFTYHVAHNGTHSNTAVVEINISALNDAPSAQSDNLHAYNSTLLQTQLTANDIDSQNLTFTLQENAEFGNAAISESGLLTYSANEGFLGDDHLTYSVSDGEQSSTAEITISVVETLLQISSPAPQYTAEAGVKQQQKTTVTNMGDEAILIWTLSWPAWYALVTDVISVPARSQIDIAFDIDATLLREGNYQGAVTFTSAEPGMPTHTQDLKLDVTANVSAPALVTDLTTDGNPEFDQAKLKWTAVADSGKRGLPVTAFDIRYSSSTITEATWATATPLALSQTPREAESLESVIATGLEAETSYYFAIKSIDKNDQLSPLSNILSFTTPLPPVPTVNSSNIAVSLKEAEQTTVDVILNNTGRSPLRYTTQLTTNSQSTPTRLASIKSVAKSAPLEASSLAENSGNIIIKLKDNQVSTQSFKSMMSQYKLQERQSINALNLKVVRPQQSGSEAYIQLINELNNLPEVAYAEPDYNIQALYLPDDPEFSRQWALNNEGQTGGSVDADIDGTETWDRYKNGSNVVVAVIDTGVKYDHEDLSDNSWINTQEIAGNGIDDDNNGFIDDVYGYDFANSDANPMDDNGHGTHCAGILGAKGDNGIGISGIAHSAQIMGLKFLDSRGSGNVSHAVASIIYAVDNGATILSNSWGGGPLTQALFDAVSYANDHDVLFIAAAGNESNNNDINPSYPAGIDLPNVISVASTDHSDQLSNFSNYGMSVDLAAPGSDILSTYNNGRYTSLSGTSMAAPYVTGAAVLLRSNFPHLSALETKAILLDSVDELSSLNGRLATNGRLNVKTALAKAESSSYLSIQNGASGEISPGESATIQIAIDATNKLAALYENQITISTNAPGYENLSVALSLTVLFDEIPPASIDDLQINSSHPTTALLQWNNTGDDGLIDRAKALTFAYSESAITLENWDTATLVEGPVPTDSGSLQEFTISQLQPDTLYYFAMRVMDNSGQYSALSNVISTTTPIGAILAITPEAIPTVTLNKGETSSLALTLANSGDETLTYTAQLGEPEVAVQQQLSVPHIKGQQDLRTGITPQSSGGPDAFGYRWSDSDEGQVNYNWVDISSQGTALRFSDDTVSSAINLGFSFDFYGTDYAQVYISSNGFLSFQNIGSGCCSGQPLPSQQNNYKNLIAWAWKDLHPGQGSVHYLASGDNFIVQFTNYTELSGNGIFTSQVILSSNGTIKLQYHSFTNNFNTANLSVGIENQDSTDGLQVVFNAAYLKDQLAVEIRPQLAWVSLNKSSGSITTAGTDVIDLMFDSTDVEAGTYNTALIINSNDPINPEVIFPVTLVVNPPL